MTEDAPHPDRVASLGESPVAESRIKGSRFLATTHPTDDAAALAAVLADVRREHPGANHHCSGARFLDGEERSDDDGEPGGTAGEPILRAIVGAGLYGVSIVVVRYFGGTKLGTGGLVRAYGDAARAAIADAPPRMIWHTEELRIEVGFDDLGTVEASLARLGAALVSVERSFGETPSFRITVHRSRVPLLRVALRDATSGRVRILDRPDSGRS